METVHLIGQLNKPPNATGLTSVLPAAWRTNAPLPAPARSRRLGKACASAVSAMARRWHDRRATGMLGR